MAISASDMKVRPKGAWYVLPFGLWAIALALFITAVVSFADIVNAGIDPIDPSRTIRVDSDGATIYSTDANATHTCTVTDASGRTTKLEFFNADLTIDAAGPAYYALATTPGDLPAGTYTLTCPGVGPQAHLGIGPRVDVRAIAIRALWGIALPLIMGFLGLAALIALLVLRHNSKMRIKALRPNASSGYDGGWNYGGYPPPSHPPGGNDRSEPPSSPPAR
ncbi:MAG: hypothetical protein ABJA81_02215 [Nocardioidaceae bacterium]